jgi:hypothetical protein
LHVFFKTFGSRRSLVSGQSKFSLGTFFTGKTVATWWSWRAFVSLNYKIFRHFEHELIS